MAYTGRGRIEAYGIIGVRSRAWQRTFKNYAMLEKWLGANEGNVEVYGVRDADD